MASPRPTILCLANSAAYSRTFFEELRPHLIGLGFNVAFALDSHLSDILYAKGEALADAWYFTDFCATQTPPTSEDLARNDLRWDLMLSDFDRLLTIDIPVPLAKSNRLSYAQIPVLLERFFTDIFDAVAPVAVLYEQASNSFALAANEIAKARNVPFFSLAPARVAGRVEISPTGALRDHVTVARIWDRVKREGGGVEARAIAAHYIRTVEEQVPDYMRAGGDGEILARTGLWSKYANLGKLRHIQRILAYRRKHRDELLLNYQFGDPLVISWSLFRRSWRRRLRVKQVSKLYREGPSGGSYFLYPLHFHPEASTSVLAPDFIDELTVIKAIAFRLPAHVKLVVKEHPSAVALQPLEFYRQLDALPNVELIGPGANAKRLARQAIGVICVTSTLGFEAAALNKPVVCLGDVLYGYFPNVRMITHYGDLRGAIDWAMNYEAVDPDDILSAMTAYVEFTDAGSFSFTGSLGDTEALVNLADIIARRLSTQKSLMNTNHAASAQ
ncbi:hypothetical protein GCM10009116_03770 [Brevundimonas basaltis]|uniref:Capsule polysaccharide biosynthesis protein n=1 Tax=Brevundimonas basaltis TaxID=472166 RepID=A0A7W8MHW4_9CAUL|nr:hypothetical protein [Brevundimonas basaltis]MBB5292647.1 hypothetical protein [Brevundimonas basaltis]